MRVFVCVFIFFVCLFDVSGTMCLGDLLLLVMIDGEDPLRDAAGVALVRGLEGVVGATMAGARWTDCWNNLDRTVCLSDHQHNNVTIPYERAT